MDNEIEIQRQLYGDMIAATKRLSAHVATHGEFWQYCTSCEQVLLKEAFYMRSNGTNRTECRHCFRKRQKQVQQSKGGKETVRKWREGHKHTEEYITKRRAGEKVRYLVKKGAIPPAKDLACRQCGKQADHYHHHNGYDDAHLTDVIPLCALCHKSVHVSP